MKKPLLFSLVLMIISMYVLNSAYAAPLSEDSGQLESGGLSGEVSLPGVTKYPDGTTCTFASQCLSQNCVDGYCCNSPCSGTCDSCSVAGYEGICTDANTLCSGTSSSCYCSSGSCSVCSTGYSCSSYACIVATTTPAPSGGGGGIVSLPVPVGASETKVWSEVTSGSTITMDIANPAIAITDIAIEIKEAAKNVQIQVIALAEAPKTAVTMKTEVFQYLKIDKTNIEDTGITIATIKFQIPKSWLSEKKIGSDEIALFKYVNNNWIELDTTILSSDNAYVYYGAKTSGFSYFAIGIKAREKEKPAVEEKKEIKEEVVPEEKKEVAPEEKKVPEITGAVVTVGEKGITPLMVTWIVILLTIAATIFIIVEMIRKPPIPGTKDLKNVSKELDKKIEKIDRELNKLEKK